MSNKRNWLVTFTRYYPRALEGIIAFGDMMQALIQTLLIGVGLPLILSGLLIVEHQGVMDGLLYFLEPSMAFLGALVLVGANLIVEIQIVHTENREGYHNMAQYDWSFQLLLREITYRLGYGDQWKPRSKSPAYRFYGLRVFITVAVFVLAFGGRMHTNIEKVSDVSASVGVEHLISDSTLADVVTWAGGTIFTMVALIAAQVLTHYIAQQVIQITADMKQKLVNLKAQETRSRNRLPLSSDATDTVVDIQDVYMLEKSRDNSIQPIREGKRYICPKCGKEMSRQGWSQHPCRFEIDVAGLTGHALAQVDKHLTEQAQVDGQANVQFEQASSIIRRSVNGHHNEESK